MTQRSRCALRGPVQLEPRDAPATLVNASTVTYQDTDGDLVTATISKPILTAGNANQIFLFATGSVNGDNTSSQQLQEIHLTGLASAAGVNVQVKATRAGGDGFVDVGYVNATGIDLGSLRVTGDLARVDAGDGNLGTPGLGGLHVQSMGLRGTSTQGAGGSLGSTIVGSIGTFWIGSDLDGVAVSTFATGGSKTNGSINSVHIGGSINGGFLGSAGNMGPVYVGGSVEGIATGGMSSAGDIGFVTIGQNLVGGAIDKIGSIFASGTLAGITIHGSILGGGGADSGSVSAARMGPVVVGQDVVGGAGAGSGSIGSTSALATNHIASISIGDDVQGGAGDASGRIDALSIGSIRLGGSLLGGAGELSGRLGAGGKVAVTIAGSIVGGSGKSSAFLSADVFPTLMVGGSVVGGPEGGSGSIAANGSIGSIFVRGSLIGGPKDDTGTILSGPIGQLHIGRDIRGGDDPMNSSTIQTGFIRASAIGEIHIGGSIISGNNPNANTSTDFLQESGAIVAGATIGSIAVGGSLIGNDTDPLVISALGHFKPTGTTDMAIGSLSVAGSVNTAQIFAGYDGYLVPDSADAQVGMVTVGADWVNSSLLAGATPSLFTFAKTTDPNDNPAIESSIAGITIAGRVFGSPISLFPPPSGFAAERIGFLKVGGTSVTLKAGAHNDQLFIAADNARTLEV
jgi:hypothetical protein